MNVFTNRKENGMKTVMLPVILVILWLGVLMLLSVSGFAQTYSISPVDPSAPPLDQSLAALGLTRETCIFPLSGAAVASDKKFEVPVYRTMLYRPFDIPYLLGHVEYNFDCYRDNLLRTLIFAASRSGASVARGYFNKPLAIHETRLDRQPDPLMTALEEMHEFREIPFTDDVRSSYTLALKILPAPMRRHVAMILMASTHAARWQNLSLQKVLESQHRYLLQDIPRRLTPPALTDDNLPTIARDWERRIRHDMRPLLGLVDLNQMMAGALDLMYILEKTISDRESFQPMPGLHSEFDTPLGRVVIASDDKDNLYDYDGNYLLIMDLGGADIYHGGGGTLTGDQPVSIILDFDGDDQYLQTASGLRPAFGAGVLGYGFLFDFRGDDRYVCPQLTQGAGWFGVGCLFDFEGDDTYECIRYGQGFAHAGVGLLYDVNGNDHYYSLTSAQGCGYTRGCGMLADGGGDDRYEANDTDIRFPSAQTREHNRSIAQGAGMGERADEQDGNSLPGGLGILLDKAGNDHYSAGVFAQGVGFWNGVGVLMDSGGDDRYDGVWYVQGAGVHGGIGALVDRDGNDSYTATLHAAQGLGHDNAIGIFVDEKGNDIYFTPRLSLGTANLNSIALFADLAGNDRYECAAPECLGRAEFSRWGTLREDMLSAGIFLDTGGKDIYKTLRGADDTLWIQNPSKGIILKSEKGVGLDGEFKEVDLRLRPLTERPANADW